MAIIKDKKDISVLLEAQLPEYVTSEHPKFKKFIEKYYEFMESQQIYFDGITFNEFKLLPEDTIVNAGFVFLAYEDGDRLQLESVRNTALNANLQFKIGETITGNTSLATAVVTGTKGNTLAFIKPTNEATFQFGEQITGSTSRAYSTLANGISANVFPEGAIESFRSRGPIAATRELPDMQNIDKAPLDLIDDSWKKEFYTNVPRRTYTDRRQLLKNIKDFYRAKGNESSIAWVFKVLYGKEDIEFYYPKIDLMRISDGRWTLDKTIKVSATTATNLELFTGRKITGADSKATAIVEKQITSAVGVLTITELTLSGIEKGTGLDEVTGLFRVNEIVTSETDANGDFATATTSGLVQTVSVDVGGTNYVVGDEITISGGGGQEAKARVGSIADSVVEGIDILDSGDGYSALDVIDFNDEGTGGSGASAIIKDIIKTGEVLINSDLISAHSSIQVGASNYGSAFDLHNANTHFYGNTSTVFSAAIKSSSGKYFDATGGFMSTGKIGPGDTLEKQTQIASSSGNTLLQAVKTVTFSGSFTEEQRRDIVGGKLTYANSNTTIITGYTNSTVFTVKDTHTIESGQTWNIYYGSNTHWGTIIGANSTQILYSLGSITRDPDLDARSANNFVNDDSIIVYDTHKTMLWAAENATGVDSAKTHTGITFDIGNTPANVSTSTVTITNAFGQSGDTVVHVTNGAMTMTLKDVGAINSISITAGGSLYLTSPAVEVSNSYIASLGNSLDVIGANNSLLNFELETANTGTITQTGNVVTLSGGTFPDANSGLLQIIYANGFIDHVTASTNSTSIRVATERNFGINDPAQTYVIRYMAVANNFSKNVLIYSDDYAARGRVVDFIDRAKTLRPTVAYGNTTLRVDMFTVQDYSAREQFFLYETRDFSNDPDLLAFEDDTKMLQEDCVIFIITEDGDNVVFEDESRVFSESTFGQQITAYSNSISTYNTGTITQSTTTVTGAGGALFPNDLVRGTLTYADSTTSIVTGYTNATSLTVDTSKTIGSGQAFEINYNQAITKGAQRGVTVAASGTGNRTVTVTDTAHYLRTNNKIKITGSLVQIYNGVHTISVASTNTYTFTLPENPSSATPGGDHFVRAVVAGYLASANAYTVDTSPKGNNATISVTAIAIGAIKTVEVYNFGAGYTGIPTLSTSTGNRNAELSASLGAFAEYAGYYTGTIGLISSTPKIQDNKYYQDFSYVLKTDFDVTTYRDNIKRLTHPSGMLLFGEVAFRSSISTEMFDAGTSNVNATNLNISPSSVSPLVYPQKHHLAKVTINSYANMVFKSSNTQPEIEVYTAKHPWQAIDARVETKDDLNILRENFRDVVISRTTAGGAVIFTVTETLHGMVVGDTIEISADLSDYYNGSYVIQTSPTTNTYTITPFRGDPGAGAVSDAQLYIEGETATTGMDAGDVILLETGDQLLNELTKHEYLKVETKALANVWLENLTNWDAPFNGAILDEANQTILLERGGSFLYPVLQFPMAETGTVSIDMSFNSDLLMEDHGYETGLSDSGYILTEDTGSVGTGPARKISLEEDTEGPNRQYESIPITDTYVSFNLLDSMNSGLLTEGGEVIVCEEGLYDRDEMLLLEDANKLLSEDGFNFRLEALGERLAERSRLITEQFVISTGTAGILYQYIDHLSTIGKILTEDGALLTNEDGKTYVRVERPYYMATTRDREYEFNLYENAGYNLVLEDDSHLIVEGDETSQRLSRIQTEEGHVKTWGSEVEFDLVESMAYHLVMENNDHHIYEDDTRAITEEGRSPMWTDFAGEIEYASYFSGLGRILGEDGSYIINEDEKTYVRKEDYYPLVSNTEIQFSLYENAGYNLILEDGSHLIEEGDETASRLSRIGTEEDHVKTPDHLITVDMDGDLLVLEDGITHFITENNNRMLLAHAVSGIKSGQSSYMSPSQLSGSVAIAHNGTSVTGAGTAFSTELVVGDVFQTSDENIILEAEGSDQQVLLETNEILIHEDVLITEVQSDVISFVRGVPIRNLKWYISKEDTTKSVFAASGSGVLGSYTINTVDEQYNIVGEDSNQDLEISLESSTSGYPGVLEQETSEFSTGISLLLEDDEKLLLTEPGEFKISSISNDTSLVVTRKHWGGTDVVPFWKQTTETEVTAVVSYL